MLRLILCCTLLFTGCVAARSGSDGESSTPRSKTAKESLLAGFKLFGGAVERPPALVLSDLDEARATATAEERKAIDTLRPMLEDRAKQQPSSPAQERLLGKLLQQFGKEHAEDFEVQLSVVLGLDRIENDLQTKIGTAGASDDADANVGTGPVIRALNLAGVFPNQSRAHAHLAQMLTAAGGDQLTGMRAYLRCLQLDPNSSICRNGLKLMAAEYTQPRCMEYNKNKFSVQRAYTASRRIGKRGVLVKYAGLKLYADPRIALNGSHIDEIAASGKSSWLVSLTPEGAGKYRALTAELAAKQDYVLVKAEGVVVAAPQVLTAVDGGQMSLPREGVEPGRLCQKSERRVLPPDLTDVIR